MYSISFSFSREMQNLENFINLFSDHENHNRKEKKVSNIMSKSKGPEKSICTSKVKLNPITLAFFK